MYAGLINHLAAALCLTSQTHFFRSAQKNEEFFSPFSEMERAVRMLPNDESLPTPEWLLVLWFGAPMPEWLWICCKRCLSHLQQRQQLLSLHQPAEHQWTTACIFCPICGTSSTEAEGQHVVALRCDQPRFRQLRRSLSIQRFNVGEHAQGMCKLSGWRQVGFSPDARHSF